MLVDLPVKTKVDRCGDVVRTLIKILNCFPRIFFFVQDNPFFYLLYRIITYIPPLTLSNIRLHCRLTVIGVLYQIWTMNLTKEHHP